MPNPSSGHDLGPVALRSLALTFALTLLTAGLGQATDSPQFRGPERDGIHQESGLLQSWPEGGPKLSWTVEGLGEGYSSLAVSGGTLYTTGKVGTEGSVHAFDTSGKKLWSKVYGQEHDGGGYPGTRTTPTVDNGRLYLMSSTAQAVALDAATGNEVWKVDLMKTFGAENLYFGISESPLVIGDKVIFTPGGKNASMVALDAATGKTVWTTTGLSEKSAYCNPRLFDDGKHRQIVTLLEKSMVGIDPENGAVLWHQPYPATYDIHAVSPVFLGDLIYVSDGYDQGGKAFRLAPDGKSVTLAWSEEKLDVNHGGTVLVDGRIYGAASNKTWHVLAAATGKPLATLPRLGKGSVVYADGRLYGYVESGKVFLVNPDPAQFEVVGEFEIKKGEGHHWAHPVIVDGVLYIRHGDALMAYDVKAPAAAAGP